MARLPRSTGFTLIEVMIVVAIVALLAVIAYPAYTDAVLKGRRGEGRAALVDLMQQQERYLTQTGSYGYGGQAIDAGAANVPFKLYSGDDANRPSYLLGARLCAAGTPVPTLQECVEVYGEAQFDDLAAGTLFIRSTGQKGCNGSNPSVCWK